MELQLAMQLTFFHNWGGGGGGGRGGGRVDDLPNVVNFTLRTVDYCWRMAWRTIDQLELHTQEQFSRGMIIIWSSLPLAIVKKSGSSSEIDFPSKNSPRGRFSSKSWHPPKSISISVIYKQGLTFLGQSSGLKISSWSWPSSRHGPKEWFFSWRWHSCRTGSARLFSCMKLTYKAKSI